MKVLVVNTKMLEFDGNEDEKSPQRTNSNEIKVDQQWNTVPVVKTNEKCIVVRIYRDTMMKRLHGFEEAVHQEIYPKS